MICSTSAKSQIRLINTTSFHDCLQFRSMKIITKYPQLLEKVQNIPGLMGLCRNVWFLFAKERYQYNQSEDNIGAQHLDDNDKDEPQHSTDDDEDIYS